MTEWIYYIGSIFAAPAAFAALLLTAGLLAATAVFPAGMRRERARVRIPSETEEAARELDRLLENGKIGAAEYRRRMAELLRRG